MGSNQITVRLPEAILDRLAARCNPEEPEGMASSLREVLDRYNTLIDQGR